MEFAADDFMLGIRVAVFGFFMVMLLLGFLFTVVWSIGKIFSQPSSQNSTSTKSEDLTTQSQSARKLSEQQVSAIVAAIIKAKGLDNNYRVTRVEKVYS